MDITADYPCVDETGSGGNLYTAIRLPQSTKEYFVAIISTPKGNSLFSPRAILLDSQGATLRQIRKDGFVFHGNSLYAGIRIHPGETYLLVASDPQSVGQEVSQTVDSTQANVAGNGVVFFTYYTGNSRTQTMTYSLTGSVTVSAETIPDK